MGQIGGREGTGGALTEGSPPSYPPSRRRLLARGLTRHCPVCGGGQLFRRWFWMVERCPRCGFRFEREPGHWVGALGMNTVISFSALLGAIVVGIVLTAPDVAVVPVTLVATGIAVLVPLVAFPFTRTLWSAVDLAMRPLEPGELPRTRPGAP